MGLVSKKIDSRLIRLTMVNGDMITGQVNLNKEPGHNRLSDLISDSNDSFVILFDATLHQVNSEKPIRQKAMFINKNHIIWAIPGDEDQ